MADTGRPLHPLFGLIRKIDDLRLSGDDRRKADAATISVKRTRTQQPDGSTKTDTLLAFDGTVGVRLSPPGLSAASFAFANYTLSRDRVVPAPVLAVGKRAEPVEPRSRVRDGARRNERASYGRRNRICVVGDEVVGKTLRDALRFLVD